MTTARDFLRWRTRWLVATALLLAAFAAPVVLQQVRAARLLVSTLEPGALLAVSTDRVRTEPETVSLPDHTALRSRRYHTGAHAGAPALLLLHGVHPLGIDEPRLQQLARAFAASGVEVHTPELPRLLSLEVDPSVVERLAACADALRVRHGGRKLGAFGVSFAGGLLLMAAATPRGERSLSYVVAVGAHHDLHRVALHYAGERARGPDGSLADAPTDPYGARVLVAAYAEALFAPEDAGLARTALRLHLAERYADAKRAAAGLSPAGRQRMQAVVEPHGRGLAPVLAELSRTQQPSLAALSPRGHLRALRVPALLLHGTRDPIVPSTETSWLAREVPPRSLARVLITPALRHAERGGAPSFVEQLRLVAFVADTLGRAR